MNAHPLISAEPDIMTGLPCIKGTRVTVANIVRQIASGRTIQEITSDYPYLTDEKIRAAIRFAADLANTQTFDLLAS